MHEAVTSPLVWLYPVCAIGVLLLFVTGERSGMPFSVFTQDPMVVAKGRIYYGFLSNLGILFWCAAASICLFAWAVLKRSPAPGLSGFFLVSGLLSALLMLDDLFQLHEGIFPVYLGIRQHYVLITYLVLTVGYLVVYRRVILENYALFMFAALAFFGLSVAEDATELVVRVFSSSSWHYLVEDGFKFFGIISWFAFFSSFARREIGSCIDRR